MLIKTVNIDAKVPVRTVTPPIYGYHAKIEMNTSDILKCLLKRALITEVLSNGQLVKLNMSNYFVDYQSQVLSENPAAAVEEPAVAPAEVAEEAPMVVAPEAAVVEPEVPAEVVEEPVTAPEATPADEAPAEVVDEAPAAVAPEAVVAVAPVEAAKPENKPAPNKNNNKNHKK